MEPIATIRFMEVDTREACVVIVRATFGGVAIALSRESNGDLEVMLPAAQARELSEALSAALQVAEPGSE